MGSEGQTSEVKSQALVQAAEGMSKRITTVPPLQVTIVNETQDVLSLEIRKGFRPSRFIGQVDLPLLRGQREFDASPAGTYPVMDSKAQPTKMYVAVQRHKSRIVFHEGNAAWAIEDFAQSQIGKGLLLKPMLAAGGDVKVTADDDNLVVIRTDVDLDREVNVGHKKQPRSLRELFYGDVEDTTPEEEERLAQMFSSFEPWDEVPSIEQMNAMTAANQTARENVEQYFDDLVRAEEEEANLGCRGRDISPRP